MPEESDGVVLRLADLSKHFGDLKAVEGISLDIVEGEFFTLVGPSGSGKTTLLRMLAGMERPTRGDILLHGERINDIPANRRPTCMVFQSLALFPHRTVGQNIEFSLKMKGVSPRERRERAEQLMTQLHLTAAYYSNKVSELSGGERQRVALARALAFDPDILFFDEPLSAIDYRLRKTLEKELKDIHRETGKTFVYITHSLEEAMVMSDRIGIMRGGGLVQVGTPDEIYNRPMNRFVSEFMGEVNILQVSRSGEGKLSCESLDTEFGAPPADERFEPGGFESGHLVIRPESVRFLSDGESADNTVKGTLYNIYSLGSRVQYQVRVGELVFMVEKLREQRYEGELDDVVTIGWDVADSILVSD